MPEVDIIIDQDVFLPVYQHLIDSKKIIEFLYGSRDSGKSRQVAQLLVKKCLEEDYFLCPLIRKVLNTIKDSQWQMIKTVVEEWGLDQFFDFNSHPLEIRCANGNKFISRGLDEPKKIKSLTNPSCSWIEEASDLEEEDWILILTSLRSNYGSVQTWATFNPDIPGDYTTSYIYKTFFSHTTELNFQNIFKFTYENKEHSIEYRATHSTYKDNPFCPAERAYFYESLKDTNEYEYKIYALGLWGKRINNAAFYSSFKYSRHVKSVQNDNSGIYHISFDQNVVPYISCTISQISKENDKYILKFIDEIALSNPKNKTECLCDEFLTRYTDVERIFFYGDASGKKRDTRSQYNDYEIVERKFKKFISNTSNRVPYSNPSVTKRRDFINRIFDDRYPIEVIIDPKCKLLITDLESVKEDIDGTKLKKKVLDKITGQSYEQYGHCFIGDTLIKTNEGYKKIKDIKTGDYVLTRKGYKKVLNWYDNGFKEVKTYNINGNKITCTEDHKFYANDDFYPIGQLIDSNIFIIFEEKKIWIKKLLSTMDINLTDTQTLKGYLIEHILVDMLKLMGLIKKLGFMYISILLKSGKYLKDFAYIIKTVMHKITKSKISNAYQSQNMQATICNQKKEKSKVKNLYLNMRNQKPVNGMDLKWEENGTKNILKKYLFQLKAFALNVAKNMKDLFLIIKYNIAVQNAKIGIMREKIESLENGTRKEYARLAAKHLKYINGVKTNIVQESAPKIERVYDIQVEDCHEYFANNILVHNCSDCFDYELVAVFKSFFDNMNYIK